MGRGPAAGLWRALHFTLLHLLLALHLHLALLLLHLHGALFLQLALLLYLLIACALLFLCLALLLHLLVACALLRLHLCLALLLRLLFACPLLRLGLRLPLLLRGPVVDSLRRAFNRRYHGQPARGGRIPLRLACWPDHGWAGQRRGFARVREAGRGQFVGVLRGIAHRIDGRLDRMHGVLERLGRALTARGW